ncbi:MAG: hypothetical protein IJT37_12775 [Lachnospiraceae bacterium]|nr:hypothetical protein [Lachnospiraceae bacterium]
MNKALLEMMRPEMEEEINQAVKQAVNQAVSQAVNQAVNQKTEEILKDNINKLAKDYLARGIAKSEEEALQLATALLS